MGSNIDDRSRTSRRIFLASYTFRREETRTHKTKKTIMVILRGTKALRDKVSSNVSSLKNKLLGRRIKIGVADWKGSKP
ncbi:hypothetical protein MLD38_004985 [Melastoma candidum]|uniref:Uncharacterized protein n=1 Tax=Melastoma candidum TaxID=119954 RepID=A0ACB9S7D2_9MYRT|nr:hypothetical protein MLD38_004985 [Melastoma candidum]